MIAETESAVKDLKFNIYRQNFGIFLEFTLDEQLGKVEITSIFLWRRWENEISSERAF